MIVETRIRHRASVVPPRKRKPVPCWRIETIAFHVAETEDVSAPVVLEIQGAEPGNAVPVRVHDGRFWIAIPPENRRGSPVDLLRAAVDALVPDASPQLDHPGHTGKKLVVPRSSDPVDGAVARSSLPSIVERVQRRISEDLLVVQGVPHRRALSPVLSLPLVLKAYKGGARRFSTAFPDEAVAAWLLDADRRESLGRLFRETFPARPALAAEVLRMIPVRVLDPEAFASFALDPARICDFGREVRDAAGVRRSWRGRGLGSWTYNGPQEDAHGVVPWQVERVLGEGGGIPDVRARVAEAATPRPVRRDPMPKPANVVGITTVAVDPSVAEIFASRVGMGSIAGGGPIPRTVLVDRLDASAARTVCRFAGREIVSVGGEFLAMRPEDLASDVGRPVLRSEAPFHALSIHRMTPVSSRPADALESYARHVVADVGGRLAWRCREPMIVVSINPRDQPASFALDWRGTAGTGVDWRGLFAFRLDQAAEAADFARRLGVHGVRHLPEIADLDASLLGSGGHAWNLKISMLRWLDGLDGRSAFLGTSAKAAVAEALELLEEWRGEDLPREDLDRDSALLRLEATLAAEMEDPFFDDAEHPAIVGLASISAAALRRTSPVRDPIAEMDESFDGFRM